MKINNAVWGTENDWSDYYGIIWGKSGFNSFYNFVSPNQLFDQSILYAYSSYDPLKHYVMVNYNYKDNKQEYVNVHTQGNTGFFIYYHYNTLSGRSWQPDNRIAYDVTRGNFCDQRPVFGLSYGFKNLRFVVYLYYTNGNDLCHTTGGGLHRGLLSDWKNNASTYPIITGCSLVPYYYLQQSNVTIGRYSVVRTSTTGAYTFDTFPIFNGSSEVAFGNTVASANSRHNANTYDMFWAVDGRFFDMRRIETDNYYFDTPVLVPSDPEQLAPLFNSLGIYWSWDLNDVTTPSINPTLHLGTITSDGKTDGTGATGADEISKLPQSTWTGTYDYTNKSPFNGFDADDPNDYVDKIDLNKPTLTTTNIFNRTFALNANNVKSLADFLWNGDETKFDEIIKGLGLMGENPIDGLIDLRLYPFDVALKNDSTTAENIVVGRTDTGVQGIKITENSSAIIDLGSCTFYQKFKNFLDYEPYTTAQLYIPYVGVVPVSTAEFMGHNISCKMIVDFVTGGCTAVVYKDDIPYIYRNGTMAVEVPMTATNSARMAQTALNNVIGAVMDTGKTIGALGNGDIGGAITGGISALSNVYSAASIPTQYQTAGASTANCATWQPQNCYFIIDRPITQIPDNYGHTVGYACEQTGTLNSFSGFTVIANPDINFKCTDTEKTMLINALQGGVYV